MSFRKKALSLLVGVATIAVFAMPIHQSAEGLHFGAQALAQGHDDGDHAGGGGCGGGGCGGGHGGGGHGGGQHKGANPACPFQDGSGRGGFGPGRAGGGQGGGPGGGDRVDVIEPDVGGAYTTSGITGGGAGGEDFVCPSGGWNIENKIYRR